MDKVYALKKADFLCLYTGFADLILEMKKQPDRRGVCTCVRCGSTAATRSCRIDSSTPESWPSAPTTLPSKHTRHGQGWEITIPDCRCTRIACSSWACISASYGILPNWRNGFAPTSAGAFF